MMFKVKKCLFPKRFKADGRGYLIIDESWRVYPFYVNLFLQTLSYNSPNTARQYAYRLCSYLNFLRKRGLNYMEATDDVLRAFIHSLSIDVTEDMIYLAEGKVSANTLKQYLTVIKQFYKALRSYGVIFKINLKESSKPKNKHSLLYGSVWEETAYDFLIDPRIDNSKERNDYIKWYSEEEKTAIISNLKTYRDKAIFSLTLEGARIDEVLSLRLEDYDKNSQTYQLYRSKGRKTGEVSRCLVLSQRSIKLLDNYLFYERDVLEDRLIDEDIFLGPEMFINLKGSSTIGKPMTYHNFWKILKRAAKRAGLDPKKVRTHSGRSTRAGELYAFQAENPGLLTDQQIQDLLGWRSSESAFVYKNRQDRKSAERIIKFLEKSSDENYS